MGGGKRAASRFASRVLRAFDLDRSGKIDFCEFVVSLWNLCTSKPGQLAHFTWDLYVDESQCGALWLHAARARVRAR